MTDHRPPAFVTGAPSGIGYELAKHSPNRAMTSRSPAPANRVHDSARKLRELRGDAWSHQADASTYDGVEAFSRFIESLGRPVEVAVLNVGIATAGSVADTALDDHLKVLAINVTGTTHMAKRVVDHMVANGSGRILIVSSVSATTPTPYEGVYGGTKRSANRAP